jgi:hypothetical protein
LQFSVEEMGVVLQIIVALVAVLVAHLASVTEPSFWPVAHPWQPVDKRVVDALAGATSFAACQLLNSDAAGAEDFTFSGDWAYTGLHNGTILRFNVTDAAAGVFRSEVVLHTGSRPLGLRFSPRNGLLYYADAHRGLVEYDSDKKAETVRVSGVNGVPFKFADHIAFTKDGSTIYMSDASTKYGMSGTGARRVESLFLVSQIAVVSIRSDRRSVGGTPEWPHHQD